jgi:hypothetical protein
MSSATDNHVVHDVTLELVPFSLDKVNANAPDKNENSTMKTLCRLASFVSNHIGCHTDNFVLWNRYARACIQKGGTHVCTFSLRFSNKEKTPIIHDHDISPFWSVNLPDDDLLYNKSVTPTLVSFVRTTDYDETRFYDMRRWLQRTETSRGYLIVMDPTYLQGHGGEEDGRYYYEPKLITVTNDANALVCGQKTENEYLEEEDTKLPAKRPIPFRKEPIRHPAPQRRRIRSGMIPRETITINTYAECYDLTNDEDDDNLPVPMDRATSK